MTSKRKEKMLSGIGAFAIGGVITALQVLWWSRGSAWVIFRVWCIPVPLIVITGCVAIAGIVLFFKGLFNID